MLIKLLLAVSLSFSVSCFAGTEKPSSNLLIDPATRSALDAGAQKKSTRSDPPAEKKDTQSTAESGSDQHTPMIDYCRNNPC
ncbi:MAG: hypothetical protein LZF61_08740 [Nitrosomonas sp.]|nr:MAG: hypothetical protein LZF61_08740 [Nitrosomonas sp.]